MGPVVVQERDATPAHEGAPFEGCRVRGAPPCAPHLCWTQQTASAAATKRCAAALARRLEAGTVVALVGELGAGKTQFVQGLARGLGVLDLRQVQSPTYTLVNEYRARATHLVHIDFYRLDDVAAARGLGLEEQLLRRDAVVAVEWADHLPELVPPTAIWLELTWPPQAPEAERLLRVCGIAPPRRRRRVL